MGGQDALLSCTSPAPVFNYYCASTLGAMRQEVYRNPMRCRRPISLTLVLLVLGGQAAISARSHTVVFGAWVKVRLFVGSDTEKVQEIKVRSLNIDGRSREFTIGESHDVTDKLFVVRRAYRINDAITAQPEWKWQRDGWLMVDRISGRISKVNLPEFDPFYSVVSWFRDYAAYCGVVDSQKLYAVVVQLGQRKPVVRTYIRPAQESEVPDSECGAPVWQKQPVRVTFVPKNGQKMSFAIHGRSGEPESEDHAEQKEGEKQ